MTVFYTVSRQPLWIFWSWCFRGTYSWILGLKDKIGKSCHEVLSRPHVGKFGLTQEGSQGGEITYEDY